MATPLRQLPHPTAAAPHPQFSYTLTLSPSSIARQSNKGKPLCKLIGYWGNRNLASVAKASPESGSIVFSDDPEDGVSLGTMKLPLNIDIPTFEALLFQWGNSLSQGANLPLPVPLKVDKIQGGARLGFITLEDGKTEVLVYIDCLVFPATGGLGPVFRAIRNGPMKNKSPPGEPRIMRSLLEALQKAVAIAKL